MTPKAYTNLVLGILYLLLMGAGAYGVWAYKQMAQRVTELEPLVQQVETLQAQYQTLNDEAIRRAEFDQALRDSRTTINRNLDKAANEDPVVRNYLDERIPSGVREAIRGSPQL